MFVIMIISNNYRNSMVIMFSNMPFNYILCNIFMKEKDDCVFNRDSALADQRKVLSIVLRFPSKVLKVDKQVQP